MAPSRIPEAVQPSIVWKRSFRVSRLVMPAFYSTSLNEGVRLVRHALNHR